MFKLFVAVMFTFVFVCRVQGEELDPRIADALERTTEAAKHYQFRLPGEPPHALELHPDSVLRWSNPVIGVIYGNVFVWTHQGRPEVIGSILQWYSPFKHGTHEFHSLSSGPVEGSRDGDEVWRTKTPGLQWMPVPGRPAIGDSRSLRLRQMRAIARQFRVSSTSAKRSNYELRLLSQPLFRYGDADSEVIDGALFAFVQGTDPEAFLLIEAHQGDSQALEWKYALARMASLQFVAKFQNNEVWRVKKVSYSRAMRGREPYSLFRFQPSDAPANSD